MEDEEADLGFWKVGWIDESCFPTYFSIVDPLVLDSIAEELPLWLADWQGGIFAV